MNELTLNCGNCFHGGNYCSLIDSRIANPKLEVCIFWKKICPHTFKDGKCEKCDMTLADVFVEQTSKDKDGRSC